MKLARVSEWKVFEDDGTPASSPASQWIGEFAKTLMHSDILGPNSPLPPSAAMRIAVICWNKIYCEGGE